MRTDMVESTGNARNRDGGQITLADGGVRHHRKRGEIDKMPPDCLARSRSILEPGLFERTEVAAQQLQPLRLTRQALHDRAVGSNVACRELRTRYHHRD